MKDLKRYINVWWKIAGAVAQEQLLTSWGGVAFLIGKLARFILFFVFIASILSQSGELAGYTEVQVVTFFLIFNVIDSLTQILFRGVYVFRQRVVNGAFDLDLLKPLPSYFRPLFGSTDILDVIFFVPLALFTAYYISSNQVISKPQDLLIFTLFLGVALVVAFSIHLFVAAMGVLTTEIDHLIQVYRDFANIARFPTAIYGHGLQFVLTFIIPIVILITVPANSLMGKLTPTLALTAILVALISFIFSRWFWKFAISRYTSASS